MARGVSCLDHLETRSPRERDPPYRDAEARSVHGTGVSSRYGRPGRRPARRSRIPGWREVGKFVERSMNIYPTAQPETAPFLAIYASRKPPQRREHAMRPEKPSLFLGPFQPWTSCLTTRPDGLRQRSDMFRPIGDRKPTYRTVGMLTGSWDPGRHPMIVVRRKAPMPPEAVAPAELGAGPAPAVEPRSQPIQPEKAPAASSLRNGNRQGSPNAAPRCGARTRRGFPCRGPGAFATADLSLEAVAPLIRQARATEPAARRAPSRTGGRRSAPRPNTSCNQEQGEAVRGLMAMDLSARQATLSTRLIRDTAQTTSAAGELPIRPEAPPREPALSPSRQELCRTSQGGRASGSRTVPRLAAAPN